MKMFIPVEVCIKRHYRTYVEADENATEEYVKQIVLEDITENQGCNLELNPNFDIEEEDIEFAHVDYDGAFPDCEDGWDDYDDESSWNNM